MGNIYEDFKEYCEKEGIDFDSYATQEGINNDVTLQNGKVTFYSGKYLAFSENTKDKFEKFEDFLGKISQSMNLNWTNSSPKSQGIMKNNVEYIKMLVCSQKDVMFNGGIIFYFSNENA